MTQKQLIRRLLGRRKAAKRGLRECRLLSDRDKAAGRLEVIEWALAALEVRKMPRRKEPA